jgi:aryl-alcohol dehydrogenase-like predicted oxidoreductase
MKTRPLGSTGLHISEIGFGAWGLGGVYYGKVTTEQGIAAVRAYLDAGGNHIDSAFSYHASEEIVGKAIRGYDRARLVLASKTFAGSFAVAEIPKIRTELEITLRDLGTDYLDLYLIHGTPAAPDHFARLCDAFDELRAEGKIRVAGASIRGPAVTDESLAIARMVAASGRVGVIQVAYSIARQKHAAMFAEAAARGIGLTARWVLESGMLAGTYAPGHTFAWPDTRNRYRPHERDAMLELGQALKSMLPPGYENPVQLAAAFALAEPGMSGILLGAVRADQVRRNCTLDNLPLLPPDLVARLKAVYGPCNDAFNPTGEFEHVPSIRTGIED